jgi:hypothetical protein
MRGIGKIDVRFQNNKYHVPEPASGRNWFWRGNMYDEPWGYRTWNEWRSFGHDANGSVDSDLSAKDATGEQLLARFNAERCADCLPYLRKWLTGESTAATPSRGAGAQSFTVSARYAPQAARLIRCPTRIMRRPHRTGSVACTGNVGA